MFHYPIFAFSRYHIPSDSWQVILPAVNSTRGPSRRYGHSMIAYNVSASGYLLYIALKKKVLFKQVDF